MKYTHMFMTLILSIILSGCTTPAVSDTAPTLVVPTQPLPTTAPTLVVPTQPLPTTAPTLVVPTQPAPPTKNPQTVAIVWQNNGSDGFEPTPPNAVVPDCIDVGWQLPLRDLSTVEGRLEPGQIRGGDYKAHGGFRMQTAEVDVVSAINGAITSIAAYRETATGKRSGGEVQYLIEIQHPCGIQVRYDHLKVLSAPIQKIFTDNAVVVGDDSRTTRMQPPVPIKAGDLLATTVGFIETGANYSFDFGVYDLRTPQPSKRSAEELKKMGPSGMLGQYGLCWYDLFGTENAASIRAIPVGSKEQGSDYCE